MNNLNIKELIDLAIEKNQENILSKSLSPSTLNHPCHRYIFNQFRWVSKPIKHDARSLRIFNRGHTDESKIIEWLKLANIDIKYEYDNGQIGYHEYNGHVKGFVDGIITKDDAQYILECKTVNQATYKIISSSGILKGKIEHYLQIQLYMFFMRIYNAVYIAINKNTDEIYVEYLKYDENSIKHILELIVELLESDYIPPQIHNNPSGYICNRFNGCPHINVCFKGESNEHNCRTCKNGKPYTKSDANNNAWYCSIHKITLNLEEQMNKIKTCTEYKNLFK